MPTLEEVKVKISTEADGKGIDEAEKRVAGFSASTIQASQKIAAGIAVIGTAFIAAAGFGVKIAGDMEAARQGFVALLGSAEAADATMARIKKEAASTPFELPGLVKGTQALAAITKDGNKAIDMLLDVGKAVAVSGKGQAELDRIVLNLQQISSTGKVTAMDIRQFQGAIPIFNDIVTAAGMTIEQLQNADNAAELLGLAFKAAGEKGGIAAEGFTAQAGTWNQLFSNFKDNLGIIAADFVTTSGIFDLAKKALGGIVDAMASLITPESIARFKEFIGFLNNNQGLFIGIGAIIMTLVAPAFIAWAVAAYNAGIATIIALGPVVWIIVGIIAIITALYLAWNNNFLGIKDIVGGFVAWIKTAWASIGTFFSELWENIKIIIKGFVDWIQAVLVPIFKVAFQILTFPLILLWDLFVLAFAAISFLLQKFGEWLAKTFGPTVEIVWNAIKIGLTAVGNFFKWIWDAIKTALEIVGNWLKSTFGPIIEVVWTGIKTGLSKLKEFWNGIWDGMSSFVSGVAGKILGFVKNLVNGVIGFFNKLINGANSVGSKIPGFIAIPNIPEFANGVTNFTGGLAIVGERGPEIVNLPKGSGVIPNNKIGSSMGEQIINQFNTIYNQIDMDLALNNLAYAVAKQ